MTYQGRLADGGSPATGIYDFSVSLYDTAAHPTNELAGPTFVPAVAVANGLFQIPLASAPSYSMEHPGGYRSA